MLSRRGALLLAVGGLAQLSLPMSTATARRSAPPPPSDRAAVEQLLADRSSALLRKDRAELLSGTAQPARGAQQELLDRMAQLPLAELAYRITSFTQPAPDQQTLTVGVDLAYRLQAVDDHPAVLGRRLGLIRSADGWLLTEDRPADAATLWDLGPVQAQPGRRSLVLGLGDRSELASLAALADQAVPLVSAVWGNGWAGRLLLESTATEAQFAQLLDVTPESYQGIAAVTVATTAGTPAHAPADRVLVNPEAFHSLSDLGRKVVITHESTHVATRADTKPWTPLWLSEGVADWTAYRTTGRTARQIAPELAKDLAAGRLPTGLPADADFTAGASGIAQAYELGWLACDLIARRFGEPKLVDFYRAVGAAGDPGQAGREAQLDQVMQRQLGLGLGAFTKLWITEVSSQLS